MFHCRFAWKDASHLLLYRKAHLYALMTAFVRMSDSRQHRQDSFLYACVHVNAWDVRACSENIEKYADP